MPLPLSKIEKGFFFSKQQRDGELSRVNPGEAGLPNCELMIGKTQLNTTRYADGEVMYAYGEVRYPYGEVGHAYGKLDNMKGVRNPNGEVRYP